MKKIFVGTYIFWCKILYKRISKALKRPTPINKEVCVFRQAYSGNQETDKMCGNSGFICFNPLVIFLSFLISVHTCRC